MSLSILAHAIYLTRAGNHTMTIGRIPTRMREYRQGFRIIAANGTLYTQDGRAHLNIPSTLDLVTFVGCADVYNNLDKSIPLSPDLETLTSPLSEATRRETQILDKWVNDAVAVINTSVAIIFSGCPEFHMKLGGHYLAFSGMRLITITEQDVHRGRYGARGDDGSITWYDAHGHRFPGEESIWDIDQFLAQPKDIPIDCVPEDPTPEFLKERYG